MGVRAASRNACTTTAIVALPPPSCADAVDFEAFYVRHYRPVVGLAFTLTGSLEAAEDLAQDAFAAAGRNWQRLAHYDDPGAWVRRVVANRSVSRVRRLVAEARALSRLAGRRQETVEAPTPESAVWAAVRSLPRRQAQVIALVYLEDLPLAEVAAVLGCSEATARTHLGRGRQALAHALRTEEDA